MSFGPFSALYFMFYETFKGFFVANDAQAYLKRMNRKTEEDIKASHKQDIGFF